MKPFTEDKDYHSEPFKWDKERRAHLRVELDVHYSKLYRLTRNKPRYSLDPKHAYSPNFPGEIFPVLCPKNALTPLQSP